MFSPECLWRCSGRRRTVRSRCGDRVRSPRRREPTSLAESATAFGVRERNLSNAAPVTRSASSVIAAARSPAFAVGAIAWAAMPTQRRGRHRSRGRVCLGLGVVLGLGSNVSEDALAVFETSTSSSVAQEAVPPPSPPPAAVQSTNTSHSEPVHELVWVSTLLLVCCTVQSRCRAAAVVRPSLRGVSALDLPGRRAHR